MQDSHDSSVFDTAILYKKTTILKQIMFSNHTFWNRKAKGTHINLIWGLHVHEDWNLFKNQRFCYAGIVQSIGRKGWEILYRVGCGAKEGECSEGVGPMLLPWWVGWDPSFPFCHWMPPRWGFWGSTGSWSDCILRQNRCGDVQDWKPYFRHSRPPWVHQGHSSESHWSPSQYGCHRGNLIVNPLFVNVFVYLSLYLPFCFVWMVAERFCRTSKVWIADSWAG